MSGGQNEHSMEAIMHGTFLSITWHFSSDDSEFGEAVRFRGKRWALGVRPTRCKSQLCNLLAIGFLVLDFLLCKMGIITSQGCHGN